MTGKTWIIQRENLYQPKQGYLRKWIYFLIRYNSLVFCYNGLPIFYNVYYPVIAVYHSVIMVL